MIFNVSLEVASNYKLLVTEATLQLIRLVLGLVLRKMLLQSN